MVRTGTTHCEISAPKVVDATNPSSNSPYTVDGRKLSNDAMEEAKLCVLNLGDMAPVLVNVNRIQLRGFLCNIYNNR